MTARVRVTTDRRLQALAAVRGAAEPAVLAGMEFLREQSNRTVPIEEGTLERSAQASADGQRGAVSYDTPYARRQHEDTRLRHDQGRRAKWLELTAKEQAAAIGRVVHGEMKRRLGGAL